MIKSYFINLDKDRDRLSFMLERFGALGLAVERVPAVDGRGMPLNEIHAFNKSRGAEGDPWLVGQIGCFMSHFAIWEKIAAGGHAFSAIFEDDVHVSDAIKSLLNNEERIPIDADIVRMECSTNRLLLEKNAFPIADDLYLHRLRSTSWCAGAYIVSRECVRRLISSEKSLHKPVDSFLFCYEQSIIARSLITYQCVPALAIQDKFSDKSKKNLNFSSNIETDLEYKRGRLIFLLSTLNFKSIFGYIVRNLRGFRRVPFRRN